MNLHPSDPLEKASRRALIVSGDDRFAAALARYVESEGWQTHVATNERDAASACSQHPPQVMLVELEGHDIDGFELIAALRAPQRGIPSILLSRCLDDAGVDPRVLRALGIVAVLRRPCPFALLTEALERIVAPRDSTSALASIAAPPESLGPSSTLDLSIEWEECAS